MDFDYIIVGAGTAGCVLADRLSASGRHRVLLLEAGGKPRSPFVKMPAGFARLMGSKLDWAFESEPGADIAGRRILVPRGKMLGGSSNMNAQIHQWCHPADFDGWASSGATGWGWAEVAPLFMQQESWCGPHGAQLRGRTGPMRVSPNVNHHRMSASFVSVANTIAGVPATAGYNGAAYEGAWLCELAHDKGHRFSVYDACLRPALKRPNLMVLSDAQVTRVLVERGRAVGVALRRGSVEQRFLAAAGVVLAAGAFGSPHLLAHSGIGPAGSLAAWSIPVVADAPEVGANLQDHPTVAMVFDTERRDTLKNADSPLNLLRYLFLKRGMLASNAVEAFMFARSGLSASPAPDIELLFLPLEWRAEGREPPGKHAFTIAPIVAAPRSRGHVRLRSADPLQAPSIDFGLLSDAQGIDARVLLAGMRLARRVAASMPAGDCAGEALPGAHLESDGELRRWLSTCIQTVYHPSSTCRMGTDRRSVVTPRLQVRGLGGLWVADASVMPSVPRGHPNAVVAMIAGRAAAWIEEDALMARAA
jgi:choline dehydrogenase